MFVYTSMAQQIQTAGKTISREIKALNTSFMILSQKVDLVLRNEKVLGKNVVVLNQKIKELEKKIGSFPKESGKIKSEEIEEMKKNLYLLENEVKKMKESIERIEEKINELEKNKVEKEELLELKYVVDAINPLEFVTFSQLNLAIRKAIREMKEKGEI